jgi:hypothetical protein
MPGKAARLNTTAQIREALGFRESTVADAEEVAVWPVEQILPREHHEERLRDTTYQRYWALQLVRAYVALPPLGQPQGSPWFPRPFRTPSGLLETNRLPCIYGCIYICNRGFVSPLRRLMLFYFLGNIRIAQLLDFS